MAYQNLEALTFNVLNQTKILSAALFCFLVMGKRQSRMQVASLVLLTLSTLIIEKIVHPTAFMTLIKGSGPTFGLGKFMERMLGGDNFGRRFTHGIIPIIVASGISGLAGALTQLNLQGGGSKLSIWGKKDKPNVPRPPRNAYLFSMEMNVASVILLLVSLVMSSGGRSILRTPSTFFSNWTPQTFIPVITNAIGGILVGLVTKHAGSVRKGFALIFGLLLSGLFQANGSGIRCEQVVGGLMAAASLWLHTVHPYKAPHSNKKA
jgi:UDP-sugar transporter A1/2/3